MNLNLFCLCTILTITSAQAQSLTSEQTENKQHKKITVRSPGSMKDIGALDEGFNEFEGGAFAIKDVLERGKVNFIRVTYGSRIATSNYQDWRNKSKYFLEKEHTYRELFLTNQDPSVTSALLIRGSTTRQSLNNRKFLGPMLSSSKTTLSELMRDKPEVLTMINKLKKITQSTIRKVVKVYNQ